MDLMLPQSDNGEYCCRLAIDLYDSPNCQILATQAAAGRHLRFLSDIPVESAMEIRLCEDNYTAWLPLNKIGDLEPASINYQVISLSRQEIAARLPEVINFTKVAMGQPNYYLWGGTIGPNYDCSGLIQAAFAAADIWIPRDSHQQAAFTESISISELLPGDLIFFGKEKVNHVALYLGDGYYIHSSGKDRGRNGIGIDRLVAPWDSISEFYYQILRGYGRVR